MRHVIEIYCNDCGQLISERVIDDNEKTKVRALCADVTCDRGSISVKVIAQAPLDEPKRTTLKLTGRFHQPELQDRDVYSDLREDR